MVLAVSALVVVAAAGLAWWGWWAAVVHVQIANAAPQPLDSLTIEVQTCGGTQVWHGGVLPPAGVLRHRIKVCSEAGLTLRVQLRSGQVFEQQVYVEPGYRLQGVVGLSGISTTTALFLP